MSMDVNFRWFSAAQLAALGEAAVIYFPRSERRAGERARKLGWTERQVQGRGGKGGKRTEFTPPDHYLAVIQTFLKANPVFFGNKPAAASEKPYLYEPINPLVSGDGIQPRLLANDGDQSFIHIDKYVNVRGAAGAGQEVFEEAIVQVRVDARLLRERIGNNIGRIKIASVSGDSMEPTLSHGDQVLIDTSIDRFIENAIYAIQQDGHLRFKRIKLKLDGSIIVKSDNPIDNEPETYTADQAQYFKIVGVVIPFKFGRFKL